MTKQSIARMLAGALLLGSNSAALLAQKGHGKMGELEVGGFHASTARAHETRNEGKMPASSRSGNSAHMAKLSNMNASTVLTNNANLAALVTPLLPAGETLAAASAGFKNVGEFVAALHVSQNLNIPFDALKAKLTGSDPESLGQAIHDLQPSLTRSTVHGDVRTALRETDTDFDTARIENQLASNSTLSTAAQALLPAGTNLQSAAAGFENVRQFLLAEHLAQDLNISFSQLKADVTGTNAMSFDQALTALLPSLSQATIKSDITTARQQAGSDLQTAFGGSMGDKNDLAMGH